MPDGFRVRVRGDVIEVLREHHAIGIVAATTIADDVDDRAPQDRIGAAVRAALDGLQDYIVLTLAEHWPVSATSKLPLPDVQADGMLLRAWFGPEGAPVIEFPAIDINQIETG